MKMTPPELSVVIVNYNAGAFLERCLASVKVHLKDVVCEICVVDNASTDGSAEFVKKLTGPGMRSGPVPEKLPGPVSFFTNSALPSVEALSTTQISQTTSLRWTLTEARHRSRNAPAL